MISDILWLIIFTTFIVFGINRPYVALSSVIFIDILKPQALSTSFLSGKPLSLIFTIFFFISFLINIKDIKKPKTLTSTIIILLLMIVVTISTQLAQFQYLASLKFDFTIKTLIFSLFIPFVINTREKIDLFIAVLIACISYFILIVGIKTLFGGGGYGNGFFTGKINDTMSESSTLSMLGTINLILVLYFYQFSSYKEIFPNINLTSKFILFFSFLGIIGTYARTGLIGIALFVYLNLKSSNRKFKYIFSIFLAIIIIFPFLPNSWLERMDTLKSAEKESSALGRLIVWEWTIDYVKDKPFFGGGFYAYVANATELHNYVDEGEKIQILENGKAFHNIYFEVLGETGYIGLSTYLIMLLFIYKTNQKTIRSAANIKNKAIAETLLHSLYVYCICGMFIGVAFYPWVYYILGITTSIHSINHNDLKDLEK